MERESCSVKWKMELIHRSVQALQVNNTNLTLTLNLQVKKRDRRRVVCIHTQG